MTERPARHAVYGELMWPGYNPTSESYGTGQDKAYALLDAHEAEVRADYLPAWEAVYEPGNVSDYLIGYTNDECAAKAAAEAWLRSQRLDEPGRLEWVDDKQGLVVPYDQWFELIEHEDDGIPLGLGLIVRRRIPTA